MIKFDIELIRKPIATNAAADWKDTAFQWKATINGEHFNYYTGCGLVDKHQRPKMPTLDDVLHSLVWDASACDMTFHEWASELGYETDSRKALRIYLECQENGVKLRKAGVNIEAERERLQDY